MRECAAAPQIWQHPSAHGNITVTSSTIALKKLFAFANRSRTRWIWQRCQWCPLYRWHAWQTRSASQLEDQHAADVAYMPGSERDFSGNQRKHATPTSEYSNILLAADLIRDRARHDSGLGCERPQLPTIICTICLKIPVGRSIVQAAFCSTGFQATSFPFTVPRTAFFTL